MDEFPGLIARDFGVRPQGKSAPMASVSSSSSSSSSKGTQYTINPKSINHEALFGLVGKDRSFKAYDDVFGGPPKYSSSGPSGGGGGGGGNANGGVSSFDYDSIFGAEKASSPSPSSSSSPVFDKPVYDDYDGNGGVNLFGRLGRASGKRSGVRDGGFDDLIGNLGKMGVEGKSSSGRRSAAAKGFDDLIPGFGRNSSPLNSRVPSASSQRHQSTVRSSKSIEEPFVVLDKNSAGAFEDMDPLAGIRKAAPSVSSDVQIRGKNGSPSRINVGIYHESHQTLFDTSRAISDLNKAFNRNGSLPSSIKANTNQTTSPAGRSPKPENSFASTDDIWVTVSEVPLFTQPTSAPPPSRPPPARSARMSNTTKGSSVANLKKVDNFFRHPMENSWSSKTVPDSSKSSRVSPIEELEDFAMGSSQAKDDEFGYGSFEEELDGNSAATSAAAMNRAEAKFKYPKEVREKEIAKSARRRVASSQERDEKVMQEVRERELREQQERLEQEQREREEKESRDRELEQREREEKEREQRKLEKEKERERQIEREKARQAVERATREARERAAVEARLKAEKAAIEKAIAARQLAERAAVQRAQAEARQRAAEGAKQRAERAAAEARERSQAEAREKAAAAAKSEVDERLKAERAASFAGANQQKNENDLESFFSMGTRSNSAPRSRTSSDPAFDGQFQSRPGPEGTQWSSTGTSSSMKKASSTTNIVDDLSSIFGATPSSVEFQEVEGESEERRKARLMRHQKSKERVAKALAEKNERDLQVQREQAERHRMAETLDIEIKRWAAGKEGNLRALLSTLQYVLWPECGWQPVSLTDLIAAASVKKVYRKATLCIHPDKVQQKGANLQQKYIAEKVFDLLKEAWNKFNSEELF
ncbi:hypothetical protein Syun_003263 [Stephania yunnanensis]|uniref:J domain-containing protein n=1 Tax=Stephania yunnanensis TaxID=152371 RepID=A0AAP0L139_9MAGN